VLKEAWSQGDDKTNGGGAETAKTGVWIKDCLTSRLKRGQRGGQPGVDQMFLKRWLGGRGETGVPMAAGAKKRNSPVKTGDWPQNRAAKQNRKSG